MVNVKRVEKEKLLLSIGGESATDIAKRVKRARAKQAERFNSEAKTNADMSNAQIKEHCQLDREASSIMEQALSALDLSARAYMRTLKVARTIADLENASEITSPHVSEALQYRGQR